MRRLIDRYLAREVGSTMAAVALVLVILFAAFSTTRFMADSLHETLGMVTLFHLVGLRTLIALEVLLPLALYLAVVMGLGRLHSNLELVALKASGVGEGRIVAAVLWLAVPVAVAVGALSLVARPWAYDESYALEARERADVLVANMRADRFRSDGEDGRVIHAERVDRAAGRLEEVFLYSRDGGRRDVILARSAFQPPPAPGEQSRLVFEAGTAYRFQADGATDIVLRFNELTLLLEEDDTTLDHRRKAAATSTLAASEDPNDLAELQWRLSRASATLLLALVGVPLSRAAPRRGRYGRIFLAVVVYAVFYNLSGVARTWVEQGVVGELPGLWWPQGVLLVVLILAWARPGPEHGRS